MPDKDCPKCKGKGFYQTGPVTVYEDGGHDYEAARCDCWIDEVEGGR